MQFVSDRDVYDACAVDWLWIFDKLIIARRQGILAAPAGIPVPTSAMYIVRPIMNMRMMGRGAQKIWMAAGDADTVPDGFFWSDVLQGRHVSVDYRWGQQALTVQGERDDADRLDRFCRWYRIQESRPLPVWLAGLTQQQEWINVEYIGDHVIEVHLRYNDDFANHDADEIWPVWQDQPGPQPEGTSWYASAAGDRLGFWIKNK